MLMSVSVTVDENRSSLFPALKDIKESAPSQTRVTACKAAVYLGTFITNFNSVDTGRAVAGAEGREGEKENLLFTSSYTICVMFRDVYLFFMSLPVERSAVPWMVFRSHSSIPTKYKIRSQKSSDKKNLLTTLKSKILHWCHRARIKPFTQGAL